MGKIGRLFATKNSAQRSLVWLFLGSLLVTCALYAYYLYALSNTVTLTQERLRHDEQRQINKITDYLQAYIDYSKTFSTNSAIQEAFRKFETLQGDALEKYRQEFAIFLEE